MDENILNWLLAYYNVITKHVQYEQEKYASLWHGMSYCSKKKSKRDKGKNIYVLYPSHGSFGPKNEGEKMFSGKY